MKKLQIGSIAGSVLTLSVLVTGCGGSTGGGNASSGSGNNTTTTTTTTTSSATTTVDIGYTGPLSGGAAFYGQDVLNGVKLAVDQINKQGGIDVNGTKVTFKIDQLDDQYLPNQAATNAKRLAEQNHTPIIFCPHSGGILAIQGFNATKSPNFILAAYSSEPAILTQNNPLTVMIPPRYDAYFKPFADKEMTTFGKKLGLIPTTTAYGKEWAAGFTKTWTSMGGTVLTDNSVDYNTTTDFSSAVSKTLAQHPDVIFVGGPSQPTGLVIKAARDQGFTGGFVVMDQAKFEDMSPITGMAGLNGSVGVMPLVDYPGPGTKQFVDAWHQAYGSDKTPNAENGLNYQAMWVLAEAMKVAGTTTDLTAIEAKVGEAAKQLPSQYEPYNITGMTSQGHLQGPLVATYVQDGKYQTLTIPPVE